MFRWGPLKSSDAVWCPLKSVDTNCSPLKYRKTAKNKCPTRKILKSKKFEPQQTPLESRDDRKNNFPTTTIGALRYRETTAKNKFPTRKILKRKKCQPQQTFRCHLETTAKIIFQPEKIENLNTMSQNKIFVAPKNLKAEPLCSNSTVKGMRPFTTWQYVMRVM